MIATTTGSCITVVERTRRSAQRLATLVERLLVLATPNERLAATEFVDLRDVVEDAILSLTPVQRERIASTGDGRVLVQGDAPLLVLSVANGLDNALKYSGDGEVTIDLAISGESALLTIDDHGPGIDPVDRERVFLPFERAKGLHDSSVRGHGIGLALVAHVLEVHGGRARFLDCETGARLRLELPLAVVRAAPDTDEP